MKLKFLAFSLLLLVAGSVFSQSPAPALKDRSAEPDAFYRIGEVRGTIKRRAAYLPKPVYPRPALEAGADGAVRVELTIDAEGSVVAAKAVSGHPLLYAAAEEAALKTKFRSLDAPGADAIDRETGFLTYVFAIEKYGWLKIGYDLALIQRAPSLERFNVARISKAFQTDWTGELEMLGKLADLRSSEASAPDGTFTAMRPTIVRKSQRVTRGAVENTIKAEIALPVPKAPSGEQIALSQNLIAALQSRLAGDPANFWRFNTGVDVSRAGSFLRDPNDNAAGAQILRQALDSAPSDTPAEMRAALKKLVEIFESGNRRIETPTAIAQSLAVLFRTK